MTESTMVQLEVTKEDRTYRFTMPIGHTYGEAYDVGFELLKEIVKMSDRAVDASKRKEYVAEKEEEKN